MKQDRLATREQPSSRNLGGVIGTWRDEKGSHSHEKLCSVSISSILVFVFFWITHQEGKPAISHCGIAIATSLRAVARLFHHPRFAEEWSGVCGWEGGGEVLSIPRR